MAVTCPKCGHENSYGALMCSSCYTLLNSVAPVRTISISKQEAANLIRTGHRQARHTEHEGRLSSHSIALYISDSNEPAILNVIKEMVLGRIVPGDLNPRFDLSPYRGQELGISRQHAILKRVDRGLVIEDMGSSNGSWLNNNFLKPYTPAFIRNGDRLRLSQLDIEIYLPDP
jgi:hypothetical protein